MRFIALMLACALAAGEAGAHGHGAIDPNDPEAWKYKLCGQMADVAMQAVSDRDKGRPMSLHEENGEIGPRVANDIIRAVYAEPQVRSPKMAQAFGRGRCNEFLSNLPR